MRKTLESVGFGISADCCRRFMKRLKFKLRLSVRFSATHFPRSQLATSSETTPSSQNFKSKT